MYVTSWHGQDTGGGRSPGVARSGNPANRIATDHVINSGR